MLILWKKFFFRIKLKFYYFHSLEHIDNTLPKLQMLEISSADSLDYYMIPSNSVLTNSKQELLNLDTVPPNHPTYFERQNEFAGSYKSKDGLYLRSLFTMNNIGNTNLLVYQILIDGDLCFSQGMRAAFCRPFNILPQSSALLDIRFVFKMIFPLQTPYLPYRIKRKQNASFF